MPDRFAHDRFEHLVTSWNSAMVVVTARSAAGEPAGCLVGFQGQVSTEPPRWGVWMSKVNHTYPIATAADLVAVHFLTEDQHDVAEHFGGLTGDKVDKFAGIALNGDVENELDVELTAQLNNDATECDDANLMLPPVLAGCDNVLIGRRTEVFVGETDHSCVVLQPVLVRCEAAFAPLRLVKARDIEAGHPVGPR